MQLRKSVFNSYFSWLVPSLKKLKYSLTVEYFKLTEQDEIFSHRNVTYVLRIKLCVTQIINARETMPLKSRAVFSYSWCIIIFGYSAVPVHVFPFHFPLHWHTAVPLSLIQTPLFMQGLTPQGSITENKNAEIHSLKIHKCAHTQLEIRSL